MYPSNLREHSNLSVFGVLHLIKPPIGYFRSTRQIFTKIPPMLFLGLYTQLKILYWREYPLSK